MISKDQLLGMDTPWPLPDVLEKLIEATEHLLHGHDCDAHGWEQYQTAVHRGKAYLAELRRAPETNASWRSTENFLPEAGFSCLVADAEAAAETLVVGEAVWHGQDEGWYWAGNDPTDAWGGRIYPTHWMPLPVGPAEKANECRHGVSMDFNCNGCSDSGEDPRAQLKTSEDWSCSRCHVGNGSIRATCFNCGTARPPSPRPAAHTHQWQDGSDPEQQICECGSTRMTPESENAHD